MELLAVASKHPWLFLAVWAYPPLLTGAINLMIWWITHRPPSNVADAVREGEEAERGEGWITHRPPSNVADKRALQRVRRYRIYLPVVALLLSLAALIVGTSLLVFAFLYFTAFLLSVVLILEFLRIRHGGPDAPGANRATTGGTATELGKSSAAGERKRQRRTGSRFRKAVAPSAVVLGLLVSAFTVGTWALHLHGLIVGPKAFLVFQAFTDLMEFGDIGDVEISKIAEGYRFSYTPAGQGSHESEFKYRNGVESRQPAKFGGVICVNDVAPSSPGTDAHDGQDLRRYSGKIAVEARSVNGPATVTFVVGGITWAWNEETRAKVSLPHPDTMPKRELGTEELTDSWREFEFDLGALGLQPEDFKRVIGGFGWVMTWPSPPQPGRTFTIEIRKARYLR